jgi:hypothetical protein
VVRWIATSSAQYLASYAEPPTFHAKRRFSSKGRFRPVPACSPSPTPSRVSSKSPTCLSRWLVEGFVDQIARCQWGGGVCAMAMLAWLGRREHQAGFPSFFTTERLGTAMAQKELESDHLPPAFAIAQPTWAKRSLSASLGNWTLSLPPASSRDAGRQQRLQTSGHRSERTHLHRLDRAGNSVGGEETVPGAGLSSFS